MAAPLQTSPVNSAHIGALLSLAVFDLCAMGMGEIQMPEL